MSKPLRAPLLLIGLLTLAGNSHAQHVPLIERMADGSTPPAQPTAPSDTSSTQEGRYIDAGASTAGDSQPAQIGDTTRALLRLQAQGSQAGAALPMLGEAASRSYQRYLSSFEHPIPEFFEAALPDPKQGGSSR
ncbi:MAG: DUF3613 domain-containing protein [Stenotrophomonas sp.]